jgi:hypothetical protein
MRSIIIAAAALCLMAAPAYAITWAKKTVDDPFSDGKCQVAEPMSWGSYIYDYPSKWDGVYWPHTDPSWIWRCEKSGYVAFGDEFEKLDDAQKVAIGAWLKQQGAVKPGHQGSLARIEELEQFRKREAAEAAWFKRLMASWLDESDRARSDAYRREAVPLMTAALEGAKDDDRIQLFFLLGVYADRFGDRAGADAWFAKAKAQTWKNEKGEQQTGIPYFNGMIDEVVAKRTPQ